MEPSTRSKIAVMPYLSSAFVTRGHESRRYRSRYLGNRVMKEDSSRNGPGASSFVKGSIFHLSMSSVSHGFSFLCVEGILRKMRCRSCSVCWVCLIWGSSTCVCEPFFFNSNNRNLDEWEIFGHGQTQLHEVGQGWLSANWWQLSIGKRTKQA